MIDLHVPLKGDVGDPAAITYITEGLDAVVLGHEPSELYPGSIHLVLTGNIRDLGIATERATKLGGVVD